MQKRIKYLYQRILNEKLREKLEGVEDIYVNIIDSIRGVKILGNQKRRKNSKL